MQGNGDVVHDGQAGLPQPMESEDALLAALVRTSDTPSSAFDGTSG